MDWETFIYLKTKDSYKRMFAEILIIVFNDILPRNYYQYHVTNFLKNKDNKSALKLKRHQEAIDWLLSDDKDLCFKVLKIDHLTKESILEAISTKFNSNKKFVKFFGDYANQGGVKLMIQERKQYRIMKRSCLVK